MKNKNLQKIISIILLSIIILPNFVFAESNSEKTEVVALGSNLTEEQRSMILRIFGFDNSGDVDIIEVTNQEEREYLGEYIDSSKIGTRAISSVYLEKTGKGKGINVELYNITWVTEEMYKNAAITAGVEDADIIVASPFDVSGTSGLTGIIKSFEDVTGKTIDKESKDLANQEMAIMGDLKDTLGNTKTIELIVKVKKEVLDKDYKSDEDIKDSVENIMRELNIELKEEDVQRIVDFLKKLSNAEIDKEGILEKIDSINIESGFFKDLIDIVKAFFAKIFGE